MGLGRMISKRAIVARAKEPSTWAGIGILASVFGPMVGLPPEAAQALVAASAALAGVLPEGSAQPPAS